MKKVLTIGLMSICCTMLISEIASASLATRTTLIKKEISNIECSFATENHLGAVVAEVTYIKVYKYNNTDAEGSNPANYLSLSPFYYDRSKTRTIQESESIRQYFLSGSARTAMQACQDFKLDALN